MNGRYSLLKIVVIIGITLVTLFLVQQGNANQIDREENTDIERRQIVAVRIKTPPKIDGLLDDAVWQKAQPSEGFTQTKPDKGKPMTQRTVIRILYDDENIYLGVQCYDSEPEKVIGTEMRRDYEVWLVNDYIRFVLDTYHDLRAGYYFGTNPLGAQVDARVTDNGNFHISWDAVWDCARSNRRLALSLGLRQPHLIRKDGQRSLISHFVNFASHPRKNICGDLTLRALFDEPTKKDVGRQSRD